MKPTLYADDVGGHPPLLPSKQNDIDHAVERILPLRCPLTQHIGNHDGQTDCACDGRGWMYPDRPSVSLSEAAWRIRLETIWAAMGIMEE